MQRKTRWILGALLTVVTCAVLVWAFQRPIATALLTQIVNKNVGRNIIPDLPDGLHLALCGTGSPFPDPTRAGPCSAIIAGDRLFIVDTGEGSARTLGYMGIPAAKIEAIFLTHFHSDHIDGLGPFLLQRWGVGTFETPTGGWPHWRRSSCGWVSCGVCARLWLPRCTPFTQNHAARWQWRQRHSICITTRRPRRPDRRAE